MLVNACKQALIKEQKPPKKMELSNSILDQIVERDFP